MLYFPSIIIFILKQKQKQCMSENRSGNMKTKKKGLQHWVSFWKAQLTQLLA